ncbi:MAG: hypothetical protein ACE5D3_00165, partial [Candidatus Binatia bacterium]
LALPPLVPSPVVAGNTERIAELERKIDILAGELRRLRESQAIPAKPEPAGVHGLAPGASRVYGSDRGPSLGGYGEANLEQIIGDKGNSTEVFDAARLVLYLGYKFNERILFNSEIEIEHASTSESGSVSLEFAALEFMMHPRANVRAGLLLVPMGFVNEMHEPPFFHGNLRPQVEQQLIPSTWSANGIGLYGELLPGLDYRSYVVTGLDAKGFGANNLRSARQKGSKEKAEDFAWVTRFDYAPIAELTLGASLYLGNSGQGQLFVNADSEDVEIDAYTEIYEAHAQWKSHNLELRALGTTIRVDDAEVLSSDIGETVAERMSGYYAEIAYDLASLLHLPGDHYLAPWFRYSNINTQERVPEGFAADLDAVRDIYELGLSYKPITEVVLKLDFRRQESRGQALADELRIGGGFVF